MWSSKSNQNNKNSEQKQATRISERLVIYSNDRKLEKNAYGEDDDRAASELECKYFTHVCGYSESYHIGDYLERIKVLKNPKYLFPQK